MIVNLRGIASSIYWRVWTYFAARRLARELAGGRSRPRVSKPIRREQRRATIADIEKLRKAEAAAIERGLAPPKHLQASMADLEFVKAMVPQYQAAAKKAAIAAATAAQDQSALH